MWEHFVCSLTFSEKKVFLFLFFLHPVFSFLFLLFKIILHNYIERCENFDTLNK